MIRRITLLSAVTISLLLGACGKHQSDEDAPARDAGTAQVQADEQDSDAPPERVDYWPVLGPLVAGNYAGACLRMPGAHKMNAAVAVGADGKIASGSIGIDIDFGEARKIMLMRVRNDDGQYGSSALLELDLARHGVVNVQSTDGATGTISLARDGVGVACSGVAASYQLNAQPLHQLLAGLAQTSTQTLSCLDTKNMLARNDLEVAFDGSVIRVGDASFDAAAAATEILTIDDAGESMALVVGMPDKRTVTLMYDGAGRLRSLMGMSEHEATHSCDWNL